MAELSSSEIKHGFKLVLDEIHQLKEIINQQQYDEELIERRFRDLDDIVSGTSRAIGNAATAGRDTRPLLAGSW